VDGFIQPFDGFKMSLVYRVEANGAPDPFKVLRRAEQVQNAGKAENLAAGEIRM
jgi:hypothetical protein